MKIKSNSNQNNFLLSDLIKSKVYLGLNKSVKDPSIFSYLLGIRYNFCIFDLEFLTAPKLYFLIYLPPPEI